VLYFPESTAKHIWTWYCNLCLNSTLLPHAVQLQRSCRVRYKGHVGSGTRSCRVSYKVMSGQVNWIWETRCSIPSAMNCIHPLTTYQTSTCILHFFVALIKELTRGFRLIKHTEKLLEDREEKLCIKVLQTLREMMTVHIDFNNKVCHVHALYSRITGLWKIDDVLLACVRLSCCDKSASLAMNCY